MSHIADAVARLIAAHGQSMTLKRLNEIDLTLKGKWIAAGSGLAEIGNTAAQQEFDVLIASTELIASAWADKSPKRGDRITVTGRDRSVLDAQPLLDGSETAAYRLQVTG